MTEPILVNLLLGYESDEAEVEYAPTAQDHVSGDQAAKPPTPLLTSALSTRPASPEPARDAPIITLLLPGYGSDDDEDRATPASSVPKIVVQFATSSPLSSPPKTTSSQPPDPVASLIPVVPAPTLTTPTAAVEMQPRRRSQRLIAQMASKRSTSKNTAPGPRTRKRKPAKKRHSKSTSDETANN